VAPADRAGAPSPQDQPGFRLLPTEQAAPAASELAVQSQSSAQSTRFDPVELPDPREAAALAGAFAADYLSWDECNPARRGAALVQYLPPDMVGSAASAALLGWSGKGRQRSEFALPGAVHPDGEGRLIVDVRVRVTPYRAVGRSAEPASAPVDELEVAGVPAVAPAPTARGWKSLDSHWVRLAIPVIRDQGRLVVDTWDEQLSDDPEPGDTPAQPPELAQDTGRGPATFEPLVDRTSGAGGVR
jgi:hypothetical protein